MTTTATTDRDYAKAMHSEGRETLSLNQEDDDTRWDNDTLIRLLAEIAGHYRSGADAKAADAADRLKAHMIREYGNTADEFPVRPGTPA